jgi:hypothetical protein
MAREAKSVFGLMVESERRLYTREKVAEINSTMQNLSSQWHQLKIGVPLELQWQRLSPLIALQRPVRFGLFAKSLNIPRSQYLLLDSIQSCLFKLTQIRLFVLIQRLYLLVRKRITRAIQ